MEASQPVELPTEEELECTAQWMLKLRTSHANPTDLDNPILDSALKKAEVLMRTFHRESQQIIDHSHLIPEPEREGKMRQCVDFASMLSQMGFVESIEEQLDTVWHKIAIHLSSQQNGHGPEAQKIQLQLLLKSIGGDFQAFLGRLCTMGGILNDQGKHAFASRIFKMHIILDQRGKHRHGSVTGTLRGNRLCWYSGGNGRRKSQLARCLSKLGQYEEAEAWNYEDCADWDATLQQEGETGECGESTLREASAAYQGLGDTLFEQKKDGKAEAAFERALDLKLKQTGIKPVLMSLLEIKDLPSESVEKLLQEQGISVPPETDKGHLADLLYEKAVKNPQHPIDDEDTFTIMMLYAQSLHYQRNRPEKLLRAESLYWLALAAKKAQCGQDNEDTLYTMLPLSDCLAKLLKLDTAVDIAKKMLASWLRVSGAGHPDCQLAQGKLQEIVQAQRMMQTAVKKGTNPRKKHGPPRSLPYEGDNHPAAIRHRAELYQKFKENASKPTSTSSRPKPKVQIAYDPTNEQDTNFAALLAVMGARGWSVDKDKQSVRFLPLACPQFSIEMKDPETKQAYAAILGALKLAMESAGKLPDGPPGTLENNKRSHLEKWYTREVLQDLSSKEAVQDLADRFSEAHTHEEAGIPTNIASPVLGKPSHPAKICVGCGKRAAQMRKCANCRLVFVCSQSCWISAWKSHRHFCCGEKKRKE